MIAWRQNLKFDILNMMALPIISQVTEPPIRYQVFGLSQTLGIELRHQHHDADEEQRRHGGQDVGRHAAFRRNRPHLAAQLAAIADHGCQPVEDFAQIAARTCSGSNRGDEQRQVSWPTRTCMDCSAETRSEP